MVEVYPRIHGGNVGRCVSRASTAGLSPHSRGKPPTLPSQQSSRRSIPAFTGETILALYFIPLVWVYPRIHGGNWNAKARAESEAGLSPHSRGKPTTRYSQPRSVRSIPAFTGETTGGARSVRRGWVYPRIHGGNNRCRTPGKPTKGLSPHSRGKLLPPSLPLTG